MCEIRIILGGRSGRVNDERTRRTLAARPRVPAAALAAAIALVLSLSLAVACSCTPRPRAALLTADQEAAQGLQRLERGEATAAARLLESARQRGKDTDAVVRALAASYVIAGDTTRAISVLGRAVAQRPRDAHLWSLLGSLQLQSGDASGLASLKRAAGLSGRWDVWRDLGEAQWASGDLAGGARSLERAWRTAPAGALKAQVAAQIGDIEAQRGRETVARRWYERSLAQDRGSVTARSGLRRLDRRT